jgi:hypothetical protein
VKRESLELTSERREELDKLAARLKCNAQRGPAAGKPSWRALIYAIADGALKVTPKAKAKARKR